MQTRITRLQRLTNSSSGNPRWRVHTPDGVWDTGKDSQAGYILSPEWEGRDIILMENGYGEIGTVSQC